VNAMTSEAICQTDKPTNEQIYERLLVSIEAGIGMLQIFIAVCDADRQRESIIAKYESELAPAIHTHRVYLDRQEPSLRLAVAQQVTARENAVAMVTGTEALGLGENDESLKKFFGYLQWTREALRDLQMPIVLWIPSRIFAQLAKSSPDFYSWRNGIFQFQPEPSQSPPHIPDRDVPKDDEPSSVFTVEQLESTLAKAISRWGKNSSNVESLYAQLGNLYVQRVRSGKAVDREREVALAEDYLNHAIALQTQFQQPEDLATSLNDLALFYKSQGKYAEAEPLFLQSLEIRERQLGADHPAVATSLLNLAALYYDTQRYAEALPSIQRAIQIYEQKLGAEHPRTQNALSWLELIRAAV
jgi:tetratricopeptide (TPR) repeat protein